MNGSSRWLAMLAGAGLVVVALVTVRLRAETVVEGIRLGRCNEQTVRLARRLDHAGLVAESRLARLCSEHARPGTSAAVSAHDDPAGPRAATGEVARP